MRRWTEEKLLCSNLCAFSFQKISSWIMVQLRRLESSSCSWRSKVVRTLKLRAKVCCRNSTSSWSSTSFMSLESAISARILGSLSSMTASQRIFSRSSSWERTTRIVDKTRRTTRIIGLARMTATRVLSTAWSTWALILGEKQATQSERAAWYCASVVSELKRSSVLVSTLMAPCSAKRFRTAPLRRSTARDWSAGSVRWSGWPLMRLREVVSTVLRSASLLRPVVPTLMSSADM
mmetsp:Transcript_9401/g.30037  ORF Transcript_9401/g.30037 Transcript_9401/m.30037 type:complete len:235 (-) Transcript_9401:521-1225(-)